MNPLAIDGAWTFTPKVFPDSRGSFHEWFRAPDLSAVAGHPLTLAQANCSVSTRGTLRGIHFADVPPGQAKYVMCARGAILDVVVDIRVGSPTFGRWDSALLDDQIHRTIYIAEGLGHAFLALTDDATLVYLCSTGYAPEREHAVNPLDPQIGIEWPLDTAPVLSPRDSAAPSLTEARTAGLLPAYDDCVAWYAKQSAGSPRYAD